MHSLSPAWLMLPHHQFLLISGIPECGCLFKSVDQTGLVINAISLQVSSRSGLVQINYSVSY